ncbi:OCRE domain-containing protein [Brachybacterium endophyticum]|uniref:OCRE domain-containing protein n=1 Tax=Brachybacterium endophyticum TaxID=2182385 RepID=UPI001057EDF0|nr:OCRE domain-containing protein [Brachybacterium endophyticum]
MIDPDRILIESTKTHRERLGAAFIHGHWAERRKVNSNVGRLLGSFVIAAVACIACMGTGFVLGYLDQQKDEKAITAFQESAKSNPIPARPPYKEVEDTGLLKNTKTGEYIDPKTGFKVDPDTMLATDPQGRLIDTRLGWYYDPDTGYYTDPASGVTVDPDKLEVVEGK